MLGRVDTRNWFQRNFGRRCPVCGQKGFLQKKRSSIVDRRSVYKVFTREKRIKNRDREVIRTEEWEETLPVWRSTIQIDCTCSNCGKDSYYAEVVDEDPEN
jgi:hypothetical protein